MHADEHAGAMNVYMTMMRTGLYEKGRGVSPATPCFVPTAFRSVL